MSWETVWYAARGGSRNSWNPPLRAYHFHLHLGVVRGTWPTLVFVHQEDSWRAGEGLWVVTPSKGRKGLDGGPECLEEGARTWLHIVVVKLTGAT